jgi:tetratricopeptide (TPR) repeat protein
MKKLINTLLLGLLCLSIHSKAENKPISSKLMRLIPPQYMSLKNNNLFIMNHKQPHIYPVDNSLHHRWIISNSTKNLNINSYFIKSDHYLTLLKEEEEVLKEIKLKKDSCLVLNESKKVAVCFQCLHPLNLKQESIQLKISNLKENVYRLAIVLSNITIKSEIIDKAQILIENGNFKQADAVLDEELLTEAAEKLLTQKSKNESERQSIAHQLAIKADEFLVKASIRALTSPYSYEVEDSAEICFRKSIRYHEKVENIWSFANFLGLCIPYGSETDSVITYYKKALTLAETDELRGIFYNNLNVARNTNERNFKEKETNYLQAFNIYQQLSKTNTPQIDPIWSVISSNLGDFYYGNSVSLEGVNYFAQAEHYYLQAINIYERLFEANPEHYGIEFCGILRQLSQVYCNKKQLIEAETYRLQALNVSKRLVQINPQKFEDNLADTYMDLGSFYLHFLTAEKRDYLMAEKYYEASVSIYEKLAENNLEHYAVPLAKSLMYLVVNIYELNRKMPQAEKSYLKAIKLLEQYTEKFPYRAENDLKDVRRMLADFYQKDKRLEAEKYYLAVLDYCESISEIYPNQLSEVARSAADLGVFYHTTAQKMPEAEKYFQQALVSFEECVKTNPDVFEYHLGTTLYNFGLCYKTQNKWTQAENLLTRALTISEKMAKMYEPYERERIQRWVSLKELYEMMLAAATTQTEKVEIADKLKKVLAKQ